MKPMLFVLAVSILSPLAHAEIPNFDCTAIDQLTMESLAEDLSPQALRSLETECVIQAALIKEQNRKNNLSLLDRGYIDDNLARARGNYFGIVALRKELDKN